MTLAPASGTQGVAIVGYHFLVEYDVVKKQIRADVYIHDDHIDVDIPLDNFPFNCKLGDLLFCRVKDRTKLGNKMDGKAHIVIFRNATTYARSLSYAEALEERIRHLETQKMIAQAKKAAGEELFKQKLGTGKSLSIVSPNNVWD